MENKTINYDNCVPLTLKADTIHLPCIINLTDMALLYMEYFPEWEDVLFFCMEASYQKGELLEDKESGVAVFSPEKDCNILSHWQDFACRLQSRKEENNEI